MGCRQLQLWYKEFIWALSYPVLEQEFGSGVETKIIYVDSWADWRNKPNLQALVMCSEVTKLSTGHGDPNHPKPGQELPSAKVAGWLAEAAVKEYNWVQEHN